MLDQVEIPNCCFSYAGAHLEAPDQPLYVWCTPQLVLILCANELILNVCEKNLAADELLDCMLLWLTYLPCIRLIQCFSTKVI